MEKAFVGFHTRLADHEAVDKFVDFIENYLAPMDFNAVIVELNPGYTYRCFPQYSNGTVTYEDLQKIAAACRSKGIEPIPLVQCLSHQSNFSGGPWPLYKDHPEFLETPLHPDDARWPDLYVYSWCASNDGVYDYIFPMMDEIIEAMDAKTVHIGMDEVFDIGEDTCPRCKGKNKAELFARTTKILHDHLAEKGIKTMMWGDRLLNWRECGCGIWDADRFGMYPAFDLEDQVTRDIIITDWHYDPNPFCFPSVEKFMKGGFTVIPSFGADVDQVKSFWSCCLEYLYMGRKEHWSGKMGGILFTHWTPMTEECVDELIAGINGADASGFKPFSSAKVGEVIREVQPKAKEFRK